MVYSPSSNNRLVEKTKWVIARNLTSILTGTFLVLGLLNIFDPKNFDGGIAYFVCLAITSTNYISLYKFNVYKASYLTLIILGTTTATLALFFITHHIHAADFLWRLSILLLAIIGIGRKLSMALIVYFIIESIIYVQFFLNPNIADTGALPRNELIALNVELIMPFIVNTYLIYNFIFLQGIAQKNLESAYDDLRSSNEENVTLLKEIHHRVKNNLQIVTSLLRLQKEDLNTEEAKTQFNSAINRVLAMSAIHEKLYQQKKLSELKVEPYLQDLSEELKIVYARELNIDFKFDIQKPDIDLNVIIPLGLIINELLTNSLKYAFEQIPRSPEINIAILPISGGFQLLYSDNGLWKNNEDSKKFGSELINILTDQINGEYQLEKKDTGTYYTFNFKNL